MTKKTYLSIDLDFWCRFNTPSPCAKFFQRVWALNLPIYTVYYHHHLLPHINSFKCDVLVNVDYHSDLADYQSSRALDFQEGTWGSFVDWRCNGEFQWRYPSPDCTSRYVGYCHSDTNPFDRPEAAHWQNATHREGLAHIEWKTIIGVGVCLSPNWIAAKMPIMEPLQKLKIEKWYDEFDKRDTGGNILPARMPKFVRVKT